jgi:two-component system alkaline phosphatase synthesis response regulator PhoP
MAPLFANNKQCILAIDDEPDLLFIIKTTLEDAGYQVITANNPKDGLDLYERNWRDIRVVLLDFIMPEMTGDAVFECLLRLNPDVRVLLLTACDDHVARRLFDLGLRGYIQKPFYLADLLARVADEVEAP